MKNRINKKIASFGASALILSGVGLGILACSLSDDDTSSSSSYNVVSATKSDTAVYKSDLPIFEIAPTTKSITISGVPSNKSIYLAKVNTGNVSVPLSALRSASTSRAAIFDAEIDVDSSEIPQSEFKHFEGEKITLDGIRSAGRSALPEPPAPAKSQTTYSVGNTKDIYVDSNVNMTQYSLKTAKLYASGDNCYVWCVESDFTKQGKDSTEMEKIAKEFKEKFEAFYPLITNVFGNESDKLINSNASTSKLSEAASIDMETYGDTGKKINIVIYDIGADYEASSQCGVLGYFYAKDYFTRVSNSNSVIRYSNEGKYFYIDAIYAVKSINTTISTLAHEFQHMINYGMKDMKDYGSPDTSYNEMLSMLCEDMMAEKLGLDNSNNVKHERLPYFNSSYFLSGIREYRNDSYAALSYSTSYGFGSWLCRQYGGAKLVKAIMENNKIDNDSLVAAVNSVNSGNNYTFSDLFKQFLIACTNKSSSGTATTDSEVFTHNQDATQTITKDSYSYPMTAIDLWGNDYKRSSTDYLVRNQSSAGYNSDSDKTGPFIFASNMGCALRPNYGMTLHKLRETTASDSSLTLTFGDSGANTVTMYVIIQ